MNNCWTWGHNNFFECCFIFINLERWCPKIELSFNDLRSGMSGRLWSEREHKRKRYGGRREGRRGKEVTQSPVSKRLYLPLGGVR
jgi:hypothetical protein